LVHPVGLAAQPREADSENPGWEDSFVLTTSGLEQEVEDFLADCRARGLSRKTVVDGYGYPLQKVLVPWAAGEGLDSSAELDQAALNRLSSELLNRKLSPNSVNSYLRAVRQLLNWAQRQGIAGTDRPQLARTRKKTLDTLTREEIQQLEDAAATERDKLIIRVLADTGMRLGELLSIRVKDLVQRDRNGFVRISGKTGERMPPLRPSVYRRLVVYRDKVRPQHPGTDFLFLAERRDSGQYIPLGPKGVQMLVSELTYRTQLSKRVHPHLFRHSAITWMLQRGMDVVTISNITGVSVELIAHTYGHLRHEDHARAMMRIFAEEE